ncbi:hypothetical protein [Acinetobacter pittii]|uniref:Uncharacterized protein n=1 Tax=Acinetobacter pittii TaxID=48296 RepID=A0A6H0G054_ACIPI|nr:hypothetical protein [Acinetobacter pittii]QIT20007.1 hypothetical protein G8E09_19550 [Acinetobacter pittii]
MFNKIIRFFKSKKTVRAIAPFDPMDFSHAVTLEIRIKKDGSKEYRPFGYSTKKGTPKTTIVYEDD